MTKSQYTLSELEKLADNYDRGEVTDEEAPDLIPHFCTRGVLPKRFFTEAAITEFELVENKAPKLPVIGALAKGRHFMKVKISWRQSQCVESGALEGSYTRLVKAARLAVKCREDGGAFTMSGQPSSAENILKKLDDIMLTGAIKLSSAVTGGVVIFALLVTLERFGHLPNTLKDALWFVGVWTALGYIFYKLASLFLTGPPNIDNAGALLSDIFVALDDKTPDEIFVFLTEKKFKPDEARFLIGRAIIRKPFQKQQ